MILLWIVPPLVLAPIGPTNGGGESRPGRTFAVLCSVTLLALIPLALVLAQIRPGWTTSPLPALAYGLAYNLLFVCVLKESFFRGIVQTALMRWSRKHRWPRADGLALLGASLLFGLVHLKGGATFALLATLAGLVMARSVLNQAHPLRGSAPFRRQRGSSTCFRGASNRLVSLHAYPSMSLPKKQATALHRRLMGSFFPRHYPGPATTQLSRSSSASRRAYFASG